MARAVATIVGVAVMAASLASGASVGQHHHLTDEGERQFRRMGLELNAEGVADFVESPEIPKMVDWRKNTNPRVVGPVENEGDDCGTSTVTMPVASILTARHAINTGKFVEMSNQQLLNCNGIYDCNGGEPGPLMNYTVINGLPANKTVPYKGSIQKCDKNAPIAGRAYGYFQIAKNLGEEKVAAYVAQYGPVFTAVDASQWQFYTGGVYSQTCGTSLDHGVLVVGYNKDHVTPYWILKNQWGTHWGEEGYIYLKMGVDECGVDQDVWAMV